MALDARGCLWRSWSTEPARPRERNDFRARVMPRRAWTLRGYEISGVRANGWGRTSSGIASWCAFESAQRRSQQFFRVASLSCMWFGLSLWWPGAVARDRGLDRLDRPSADGFIEAGGTNIGQLFVQNVVFFDCATR